jgi:hypothetical protein
MANLIIRPASGAGNKVVVQDQAGAAVLTTADSGATIASNVTGIPAAGVTGTLPNAVQDNVTRLGTVTSGTLGASVVFNDAHKDIDCDADSWGRYAYASQNFSGASIAWDGIIKMGTNVTYDGTSDYIQVTKAGWYLVTFQYAHDSTSSVQVRVVFRKSQTTGASPSGDGVLPRLYTDGGNNGTGYWSEIRSGMIYLNATDRVDLYGQGHIYGTPLLHNAMSLFTGVRLGA